MPPECQAQQGFPPAYKPGLSQVQSPQEQRLQMGEAMKILTSVLSSLAVLISLPVLAHHGFVTNPILYKAENLVELEGELTEVFWHNPHARARLKVVDDNGEETIWELELGPGPRGFESRGISPEDLLGHVKAAGHISRRDPDSLGILHLLLPDGQELVNGNRELRWSNVRTANASRVIDPARVEAAEQAATSIFRVWGGNADGRGAHPPVSAYDYLLTERGRELAASYDAVTQNPELDCKQGMPTTMFDPTPMQIVDAGDRILILGYEYDIERVIHMDADESGVEPQGSPLGYSVGRWDGDTLHVTTTHIDWPYLDPQGTPQSDQMRYTETFALSEDETLLSYAITFTDPSIFRESFTLDRLRRWTPERELESFDCVARWEVSAD